MGTADRFVKLKDDSWLLDTKEMVCYKLKLNSAGAATDKELCFKIHEKGDKTYEFERGFGVEVPLSIMKLAEKYLNTHERK